MRVDLFDFELPEAAIALRPASPRDASRLLVVRPGDPLADRGVRDLPSLLSPGDALVFNDTRVIPARLSGIRHRAGGSGQRCEAMLHLREAPDRWRAFARPAKRLAPGDRIRFGSEGASEVCALSGLDATVEERGEGGEILLRFDLSGPALDEAIAGLGALPLPPYIAGKRATDAQDTTRPSMPASPARLPPPPPACISRTPCSRASTRRGSSGSTSPCMSGPAHSCP
jgi:S-adenosylmethionine:tRNA ribosyltransferase-isomerase